MIYEPYFNILFIFITNFSTYVIWFIDCCHLFLLNNNKYSTYWYTKSQNHIPITILNSLTVSGSGIAIITLDILALCWSNSILLWKLGDIVGHGLTAHYYLIFYCIGSTHIYMRQVTMIVAYDYLLVFCSFQESYFVFKASCDGVL